MYSTISMGQVGLTFSQRQQCLFKIKIGTFVTGSGKRYIVAHTMNFLYKRCCSKTRNIFYTLKKNFFWLRYLQLSAYTHAKFKELNVLLTGQACCLKTFS